MRSISRVPVDQQPQGSVVNIYGPASGVPALTLPLDVVRTRCPCVDPLSCQTCRGLQFFMQPVRWATLGRWSRGGGVAAAPELSRLQLLRECSMFEPRTACLMEPVPGLAHLDPRPLLRPPPLALSPRHVNQLVPLIKKARHGSNLSVEFTLVVDGFKMERVRRSVRTHARWAQCEVGAVLKGSVGDTEHFLVVLLCGHAYAQFCLAAEKLVGAAAVLLVRRFGTGELRYYGACLDPACAQPPRAFPWPDVRQVWGACF